MILVDTSVWIDFLHGKGKTSRLSEFLTENQIVSHPWIIGELALGSLGSRQKQILSDIQKLPQLTVYEVHELIDFVEREKLGGKGISLVDLQLLYAAILNDCSLWTHDRRLESLTRSYRNVHFVA